MFRNRFLRISSFQKHIVSYSEFQENLKKTDLSKLSERLLYWLGENKKYTLFIAVGGSLAPESDIDTTIVFSNNSPNTLKQIISNNPTPQVHDLLEQAIDFGLFMQSEFEKEINMLDIEATQPLLEGVAIMGEGYYNQMKQKIINTIPSEKHAFYAGTRCLNAYDNARMFLAYAYFQSRKMVSNSVKSGNVFDLSQYKNITMQNQPVPSILTISSLKPILECIGYSLSYLGCYLLYSQGCEQVQTFSSLLEADLPFKKFYNEVIDYKRSLKREGELSLNTILNYLNNLQKLITTNIQ